MYRFFEPELPSNPFGVSRLKTGDGLKPSGERRPPFKAPGNKSGSKSSQNRLQQTFSNNEKKFLPNSENRTNGNCANGRKPPPEKISWNVLDLKGDNYFSCAVGRTRTNARYTLTKSDDVVAFLTELARASSAG